MGHNKDKVKALSKAKWSQNGNTGQIPTNGGNQTFMVKYHSSSKQMVPYNAQYHPNIRYVGSVQLPPYPTTEYPTPPLQPPTTSPNDQLPANGSINSLSGDVGQYFGGNNGYFWKGGTM